MKRRFSKAIGLEYGNDQHTPAVTIKGDALDADTIVGLARQFGIPVVERGELAKALDSLEVGEEIPEALYRAVAVVLSELEKEQ